MGIKEELHHIKPGAGENDEFGEVPQ